MTKTKLKPTLFVLCFAILIATSCKKSNHPPNIVIILADDLGYGDLSVYDGWIETPNIANLAKEGMRFTDFHSNGPVCSPTRAALLTGRYQQRSGIDGVVYASFDANRHHGLFSKEITFSELFKENGYKTAIFGKWHLGYEEKYNPVHHGFDKFVGYVSGNVDYFSHVDGVGVFDWWHNLEKTKEEGYVTHLITKHAVNFIRENKDQPFCMYIAHEAPHFPFQGPDDEAFRKIGERVHEDRSDSTRVKNAYRQMVEEMDKGIGEVITTLTETGLEENTLVFFFSDNGALSFGSNGNLRGYKGKLWEGGHRVPAIAVWPGKIKPSSINSDLYLGMDIMPTILEICNIQVPNGHSLDGVSLKSAFFGNENKQDRVAYWDYNNQQAMRDGSWKLILTHNNDSTKYELFNVQNDLEEKVNLAEKYPDIVKQMETSINEWNHNVSANATQQPEK